MAEDLYGDLCADLPQSPAPKLATPVPAGEAVQAEPRPSARNVVGKPPADAGAESTAPSVPSAVASVANVASEASSPAFPAKEAENAKEAAEVIDLDSLEERA